jgi:hypothetical protein
VVPCGCRWELAPRIRAAILERLRGKLAVLRQALAAQPA